MANYKIKASSHRAECLCSTPADYRSKMDRKEEGLDNSAKEAGQRAKGIEEMISYALGHRVRIEILAFLTLIHR